MNEHLATLLDQSASRHDHLCPRQVLGVRVGLAGVASLGIDFPVTAKSLLVIVETDGCFADGIEVATGCTIGHRRLRVEDYGKTAAAFIDIRTGQVNRVSTALNIRQLARAYAPDEPRRYFAQLCAYQIMPDEELVTVQPIRLETPLEDILSRAGLRVDCDHCGEEIINEREIRNEKVTLCKACAGQAYYQIESPSMVSPSLVALNGRELR
jgi:formylmethanofuran dehydrogenase subunit E